MLHFAFAKQGFHVDEIYSYGLSNSYYNPFPTAINEWTPSTYYQNYLMPNHATAFEYGSVMSNQVNDVHPPLYYLLFHTIASFWQGGFSPMVGLTLNLGAHIATVIVLFFSIYYLTKNFYLSIFAGLFWGLSIGGLSSMLFIRMYHLMGFFVISLLYLLLRYSRSNKSHTTILLIPIFIATLLGALTHYYFYLYAFFIVAVACIGLLMIKEFKKAIILGVIEVGAIGVAWGIFPAVFSHIFASNRGVEVLNNANNANFTENLKLYLSFVQKDLLADVSLPIFIGVLIGCIFLLCVQRKTLINRVTFLQIAMIILPMGLYIFLVQDLSHYHTARYIYPIYSVVAVAVVLVIYFSLRAILSKPWSTAMTILGLSLIVLLGFKRETVYFQYSDQGALTQSILENPTNSAMVFSASRWQIAEYSPQLALHDEVYPMILESTDASDMPVMEAHDLGEPLTIYTNSTQLKQEDLIQSVLEKYQLTDYKVLHQTNDLIVYYFE